MSDAILRHHGFPFIDAREKRLGAQAGDLWTQDLLQFVAHDSNKLLVTKRPDTLRIASGKKTTQQGAVIRSAMGKFVVNESRGQQLLAFAPRYQKSKAGRQSLAHIATIAETHGDRRTVLDRSQFGGKLGTNHAKHLRGCRSRQCDDDRVEGVRLHSRRNYPAFAFALHRLYWSVGEQRCWSEARNHGLGQVLHALLQRSKKWRRSFARFGGRCLAGILSRGQHGP